MIATAALPYLYKCKCDTLHFEFYITSVTAHFRLFFSPLCRFIFFITVAFPKYRERNRISRIRLFHFRLSRAVDGTTGHDDARILFFISQNKRLVYAFVSADNKNLFPLALSAAYIQIKKIYGFFFFRNSAKTHPPFR